MKGKTHMCLRRLISGFLVLSLIFTLVLPAMATEQPSKTEPKNTLSLNPLSPDSESVQISAIPNHVNNIRPSGSESDTSSAADRYTVLLLDVEYGFTMMNGDEVLYEVATPLETVKEAALKFIEQIQKADGTNHVAIVTYSAETTIDSGFSTDGDALTSVISTIQKRTGMANINDALLKAEELMSTVENANALKNIVLFTQGVAGAGDHSKDGPYSSDDCNWYVETTGIFMYEYSNAAYATAKTLMEKYNLYSIGLYQNFNGVPEEGKSMLNFAKKFSEDVQNCGFQDVDNVDDLVFVFGELADTISADSLKQLYIDQHIYYADSNAYQEEIVAGYDIYLDAVLQDALSDSGVKGYNLLDAINSWAQLDIELDDEDLYSLLLAELLYNEQSRNKLQELYNSNLSAQIVDTIQFIMDKLEDTGDIKEREKIETLLDRLKKTELGSSLYTDIYGELMDNLTEQYSFTQIKDSLLDMAFIADIGIDAVSQVASTTKELIAYVTYGQAYMNTSDDFKDVLFNLYVVSELYIGSDHFLDKLGAWDALINVASFRAALREFIVNMEKYEKEGAKAVADFAIEAVKEGTAEFATDVTAKVLVQGLDTIFAHFPILNLIPAIKTGLEAGQLIIEITTNVDERAYSVDMIIKLYCMAYMMDYTVQEYADRLTEDDFAEAARFDEAVNVYKSIISIAADYGMKYEKELLAAENRKSSIYRSAKKASWYSTAISTMAVEKLRLEDIQCHTTGLIYDHNTGEITYDDTKLKIFTIACPVEVTVATESGKQIAFLAEAESVIAGGYEHYFFTVALDDGSGEYIKIAIVPEDYEVTIGGNGTGVMNAFVADFADDALTNAVVFQDIPITADTQGYFAAASDADQQVLLTVDDTTHTGRHSHTYHPVFTWSEEYAACTATFTCEDCGDSKQAECTVTKEVNPATAFENGQIIYTAEVVFCEEIYTDEVIIVIPPTDANTIASGTCGESSTWILDSAGLLTIAGTGNMDDYSYNTMPWNAYLDQILYVIVEDGITSIGEYAFSMCTNLTNVQLSENLTAIKKNAFNDCSALSTITIPDTVTIIDNNAFSDCGLTSVVIPENVVTIGTYAFEGCANLTDVRLEYAGYTSFKMFEGCIKLKNVSISDRMIRLGELTFKGCTSLDTIHIPTGIRYIEKGVFVECSENLICTVDPQNPSYCCVDDVIYSKDMTQLVFVPQRISGTFTIPEAVSGIQGYAFSGCRNLTSIIIPDNVSQIGESAFSGCSRITSLRIPEGVTQIKRETFADCSNLANIFLPEGITCLGYMSFSNCTGLREVTLPKSIDTFEYNVFSGCAGLTQISLPDGMTNIPYQTFYKCSNLTKVKIPDSVTIIGNDAFRYCSGLISMTLSDNITQIGQHAFDGCTRLTEVTLPNGLKTLDINVFTNCSSLSGIVLPESITHINSWAFAKCSNLKKIIFKGHAPQFHSTAFLEINAVVYYPANDSTWTTDLQQNYGGTITWIPYSTSPVIASGWSGYTEWFLHEDGMLLIRGEGSMKYYENKSETPWYAYTDQITSVLLEEGVTSIGSCAFYGMDIESIVIPSTVTSIGNYAFKNCTVLDGLILPEGLTKLGESAFYACTSLTSIEIPASLWTIQPYTFKNCTALAAVTFHEGNLQKISDGAFYNTALTALQLPNCLDILDEYSFKNCASLERIVLGSGLNELREAVFYGTAIPTITVPEGITKIGPYAFKNCVKLETVDFPSTLTSVGEASFYACTALKAVELPDAATTIGNYAFRKCAAIETLTLGAELNAIGECGLYGCTSLTELVIPDKVTTIKPYAFKGCTGLEYVNLPGSLMILGDSAFHTCPNLSEVTIPAKVTTIGAYCFSGSTGIDTFFFLGSAPTIGSGAFNKITATNYYPSGNATWTSDIMQNYGGKITWMAR